MKRYRLRKWVKVTLSILVIAMILLMGYAGIKNVEANAKSCDNAKGYTCSYYEIRQHQLGK